MAVRDCGSCRPAAREGGIGHGMTARRSDLVGSRPLGHIDLPDHIGPGGFDPAAVDRGRARVRVARTANLPGTHRAAVFEDGGDLRGPAGRDPRSAHSQVDAFVSAR